MDTTIAIGGASPSRELEPARPLVSDAGHVLLAVALAFAILACTALGFNDLATGVGYVAVLVAIADPLAGLGVLLLHAPFQELTGYGPLAFHGVLITAVLLGSLVGLRSSHVRLRLSLVWALFLAFGIYSAIQVLSIPTSIFGVESDFATGQLVGLAAGGGTFLAAEYLMRDRDWGPYLDLLVISGVFSGLLAIGTSLNDALTTMFPGLFVVGVDNDRAIGPFDNANYFGLFAAIALIICVHRITRTHGALRLLELVAAAVIGVATVLSFSRAALASVAIGLVVLAFGHSKKLGVVVAVACVAGAILVASPFIQTRLDITNPNQYIADQLAAQAASDQARYAAGSVGILLFEQNPIFGIGFGQYHFLSPYFLPPGSPAVYAHDWYANVLAESGIIGVTLIFAAAVGVLARVLKAPSDRRTLALALLAGYVFGNVFTESPTYLPTSAGVWFVVGAAIGVAAVAARGKHVDAKAEVPPTRFVLVASHQRRT